MKTFAIGMILVVAALWISACAPLDQPAQGDRSAPVKRPGIPGVMNQGGMLDDEMNFGRTY